MAGQAGPLAGRERERASLATALEAAAGGRGHAAAVLGDPGIGKTTLVEALAADADRRGLRVAWGRCTEIDAPAFWPWRQALPALGVTTLANDASTPTRSELFARVVDELSAADEPAVLALEDIHWADAASLALLRFVVDFLPGLPLLLVLTARDDPMEAGAEATELLRSLPTGVERLELSGLDPDGVAEVVAHVLGHAPDADLVRRIIDRCGGNPYFVREVAQLHASRGGGAAPAVPPGVRQVLERRLARLSPPCRNLLSVAAVVGDPAPDLLAEVVAEPLATVMHGLSEAVTARLLHSDGSRFRFAHALVRETLYAQQTPAARGALHRRVAEALERHEPKGEAAALAVHWRLVQGEDAGHTAASWALAAAREARARLGYEQAVRFYEWAIEAPPEDVLTLRIEYGEAQMLAGALTGGRDTLLDAAREARRAGWSRELARAVLGTGVGGFEVAPPDDEQVALLGDALAGLSPSGDDGPLRAAVLARLSVTSAGRRPVEERVAMADESIALARATGDAASEVAALAAWCDARSGPDDIETRLDRADQMIAAAERSGDSAGLLLARRLRLVALAERGEFTRVDAEVAAYARSADRLRLPLYAWPVPIWRGARGLMCGDLDEARRQAAEAERLATRADSLNAAILVLVLRLFLLEATGEQAAMAAATDRLREVTSPEHPQADSVAGFYAGAGRLDDARRLLRHRVVAGIDGVPKDAEYLTQLWLFGSAAIALDDTEAASLLYEAMRPYADRWVIDGILAACAGVSAHQLGRLAICLGRPHEEAVAWLERARDAHRDAGASLLVAQTERILAEMAVEPSDAAPRTESSGTTGEFRRSGRTWQLRWDDGAATVPDSKGMRDLAVLLAVPNREVSVLELMEATGGPAVAAVGGHTGERLDRTARAAYRQRLSDLEDELSEAEAYADTGRVEALRRERDFLAAELAGALGLGGRARTEGDPVERARKAVTMRIRTALKAIAEVSPGLARHLDRSVTTGRFCAYRPEHPVRWQLEPTSPRS